MLRVEVKVRGSILIQITHAVETAETRSRRGGAADQAGSVLQTMRFFGNIRENVLPEP